MKVCSWSKGQWLIMLGVGLGCHLCPAQTPSAEAAGASNSFAFRLAPALHALPENYVVCPYALHRTLSLALEGAEGKTAEQLQQVLGWKGEPSARHEATKALGVALGRSLAGGFVVIDSSQHLWVKDSARLEGGFSQTAREVYGVTPFAFGPENPERTRQQMNAMVAQHTRGRIRDLLPPGAIGGDTKLILASTLYFKGLWVNRFPPERTMEKPFWVQAGKREKLVKTMRQTTGLRHAKVPEHRFAALELPMSGTSRDFSMLILLPDDRNGVGAVEQKLTLAVLEDAVSRLTPTEVAVSLPKFSFSLGGNFTATLAALGLDRMFSSRLAELGPMSRQEPLFVSGLLKEATVEVSETGAEATAATAAFADPFAADKPVVRQEISRVVPFIADRPFVFFIRHQPSGLLLVMGRVGNP